MFHAQRHRKVSLSRSHFITLWFPCLSPVPPPNGSSERIQDAADLSSQLWWACLDPGLSRTLRICGMSGGPSLPFFRKWDSAMWPLLPRHSRQPKCPETLLPFCLDRHSRKHLPLIDFVWVIPYMSIQCTLDIHSSPPPLLAVSHLCQWPLFLTKLFCTIPEPPLIFNQGLLQWPRVWSYPLEPGRLNKGVHGWK